MGGIFQQWQPRYAEHGVATFPVREKRPAVSGYLKMGLPASEQLAIKFPNENAFGLACRRNRITVLDVDSPDERLLADALSEFGPTPFIVRSGSGNFQAWYRHNGEKRRVRPDPRRPIDVLGDGFVVAPPSEGAKGRYAIIEGALDDLARLPALRLVDHAFSPTSNQPSTAKLQVGKRNQELWRACMKRARGCREVTELMRSAVEMNQAMFYRPLPDEEVLRVVASAWSRELSGQNWFGSSGKVVVDAKVVDDLLIGDQDALLLLTVLHRHHTGKATFVIANAMHETMGWRRQRLAAARRRLEQTGFIEEVRARRRHEPAAYRFRVSRCGH